LRRAQERLFLEVAKRLGRKVWMSTAKKAVMDCLDLPPEYAALPTSNHLETNIHAVSPPLPPPLVRPGLRCAVWPGAVQVWQCAADWLL
jgi:hypothetical protein